MKTNGTGWIPINFNSYAAGSVISKLPVDPTNTTSTGLYYTYETDGIGGYKVAAFFESQKDAPAMGKDSGTDPLLYEQGSNLALVSGRGLVGYWNLNEGTGSTTIDLSGNGNNGTWYGTATGASGYYSPGKVGPWAGVFDGSTDYIKISNFNLTNNALSVLFWVNTNDFTVRRVVDNWNSANGSFTNNWNGSSGLGASFQFTDSSSAGGTITGLLTGVWYHIAQVYDGSKVYIYLNGLYVSGSTANKTLKTGLSTVYLGGDYSPYYFNGLIDDVRIYNRALSAAEVQEIYNAEK